ncbi:hypothetical protein [Streptomyces sp. CBMA152]|uniref:hypothetical protein n=1 Tax=Streptomyces sp. CBMA152 TaxID=1896312 RepID=UPI00166162F3|nr:hypothetical protein [Streptomyces sp. CBMA152]MBD0745992.1 hypothetical protein [Streptomyces sp. CBMA152]
MRNARSRLSALAALLLTVAAVTASAPPAGAVDGLNIRIDRIDVLAHRPFNVHDALLHTDLGALETVNAAVFDGGVDVGEGVVVEPGNGGTETLDIPLTVDIGFVNSGDHPTVVASVLQADGGAETVTHTFTFTCHLNALGTGSCS